MGVATILEARGIALLATGEHKAAIVRRAVEGEIDANVAATYLQRHPNATVYLDRAAAAELTRVKSLWVVGEVTWNRELEIQPVIWLSEVTGRSVLKLEAKDYRDNHLSSLLAPHGIPGPLNGEVFNSLIARIRGRSNLPEGKRIVIFSPHPDDDVISMGGVHKKLHQNGNEIISRTGCLATSRFSTPRCDATLTFLRRFDRDVAVDGTPILRLVAHVEEWLLTKQPGDVDSPVQNIKKSIREAEAGERH